MPRKKIKNDEKKKTGNRTARARSKKSGSRQLPEIKANVSDIISAAINSYRRQKYSTAYKQLSKSGPDINFQNKEQELDYYRFLVFAAANCGKNREAEIAAQKGLTIGPDDRDFYFALAFIYDGYKDYDNVIKHSKKFLELYEKRCAKDKAKYISDNHVHLIHNYLGLAYKNRGEIAEAVSSFSNAIKINPSFEHAYLNLADLYRQEKQWDKAEETVRQGLEKCSQVQELRMMLRNIENRATICACMIVKNEGELLPGCLESVRHWVDEIVIVDTGSTDRTVDIARSYGARVYFREWDGSFSNARNYALSKVTSDWVLYIDADEEFVEDDVPLLKKLLQQTECRLISVNIDNVNKETGEITSTLIFNRVFRADAGFSFEGIVHNQLKHDPDEKAVITPIRIKHYGYTLSPEKMKAKTARTRKLLEQQLENDPEFAFVHFNMAQVLRSVSVEEEPEVHNLILKHAQRVIELTEPTAGIYLMAHHQIASAYFSLKEYKKAVDYCKKSLELKPDYLDGMLTLGHVCMALQEYDEAEKAFQNYLKTQEEFLNSEMKDSLTIINIRARFNAYYHLGMIRMAQGKFSEAEDFFQKTLADREPYLDTYSALTHIYLNRNELDKAKTYIDKELAWKCDSELGNLYMGRYLTLSGKREDAFEYMDKALGMSGSNVEVLQIAGSYMAGQSRLDKAIPAYEKLTVLLPKKAENFYALARMLYDDGQIEKAREIYGAYLEMSPDDVDAIINLGNCHFALREFEKAEELYAAALDIDEKLSPAYRNLGIAKYELGKLKESLTLLENYIEYVPEDLEIEKIIGAAYGKLGRYADAIPHFERVLTGNPNNIEALFSISECYYSLGHAQSAAIGYRQILKIKPNFQPAKDRLVEFETAGTSV